MDNVTHNQLGRLPRGHESKPKEEWEEWEDDEAITPIDTAEQVHIQGPFTINKSRRLSSSTKSFSSRISRQPTVKIQRLKSRQRQKAQNAKAGIKLVTDMTALRRKNHIANQMKDLDPHAGKFVDAAALKALEGEPTSASVGNWNWLKRNKTQSPASASTPQSIAPTLSPEDRPIVIGLSMSAAESSDDAVAFHHGPSASHANHSEPKKSVWSPDTPSTASSFSPGPHPTSSIYSQATGQIIAGGEVPPVPMVPDTYRQEKKQRLISLDLGTGEEDDSTSPHTLFEEDGVPSPEHQARGKTNAITPNSAESTSRGWWDHVVTPFTDKRLTFTTRKQKAESPQDHLPSPDRKLGAISDPEPSPSLFPHPLKVTPPIIRAPTPKRTPSPPTKSDKQFNPFAASIASSSRSSPAFDQGSIREKTQPQDIKDAHSHDQPPPYSPPKRQDSTPVKYKAVFPPGHPFHVPFPPSPGPQSPGLAATMTSQGATALTDMRVTANPLPARPVGAQLSHEHAHAAPGTSYPVERERRRHEKEDFIARKVGGLWRGRGCMPESGCFGRTGPEGRKKRRIWLGIGAAAFAVLILVIVLAVVLTRPGGSSDLNTIWVNLTDYPPMPTGVLTVVGPDNTVSESGCTRPSTMWSCFLPKEGQNSVAPFEGDQPTVIMQIQWDNSSREAWKTPNGDPPKRIDRRGLGFTSLANRLTGRDDIGGFDPKPSPPDFKEMFFLGDTTDNVTSEEKGGEPTPFYISLLDGVNDTISSPELQKRQKSGDSGDSEGGNESLRELLERLLPPELDDDGTPTRARLLPNPIQQPVRLYDRGLDTEHYGFYTYFRKTIFLKSVDALNETDDGDIPIDEEGGCRKTEAALFRGV